MVKHKVWHALPVHQLPGFLYSFHNFCTHAGNEGLTYSTTMTYPLRAHEDSWDQPEDCDIHHSPTLTWQQHPVNAIQACFSPSRRLSSTFLSVDQASSYLQVPMSAQSSRCSWDFSSVHVRALSIVIFSLVRGLTLMYYLCLCTALCCSDGWPRITTPDIFWHSSIKILFTAVAWNIILNAFQSITGELQHRNLSLQEQVKSLNQQVQQQNVNLQQLQELTNMLQESHRYQTYWIKQSESRSMSLVLCVFSSLDENHWSCERLLMTDSLTTEGTAIVWDRNCD